MESLIHLRKGRAPKRLHADLDGLKDDELVRGGLTRRTANMYRRHDPTAYRSSGPPQPADVPSSELKREAVGICTDWLHRHGFSSEGRSVATGESTP